MSYRPRNDFRQNHFGSINFLLDEIVDISSGTFNLEWEMVRKNFAKDGDFSRPYDMGFGSLIFADRNVYTSGDTSLYMLMDAFSELYYDMKNAQGKSVSCPADEGEVAQITNQASMYANEWLLCKRHKYVYSVSVSWDFASVGDVYKECTAGDTLTFRNKFYVCDDSSEWN